MIRFFQGIKRAADFFNVNPSGVGFGTERRLQSLEVEIGRLPKAISDRNLTSIMNLEYDIYELKETIKTLQNTLDKEQVPTHLVLPAEQAKTFKKPKAVKLQAVEETVKKVKSLLTQAKVKRLFEYRDGELYWKINIGNVKKGNLAGSIHKMCEYSYRQVCYKGKNFPVARIIFLMFHGYLPEYVSYIDGNSKNTRIENLREANCSRVRCFTRKSKNNTSGYKGVVLHKLTGKYMAQIGKNKKNYHLGLFDTPQEAYKAYCKAAKKLHGEFARVA